MRFSVRKCKNKWHCGGKWVVVSVGGPAVPIWSDHATWADAMEWVAYQFNLDRILASKRWRDG